MKRLVSFQLIRGKWVHKPSFAHGRGTAALDLLSTTERSVAEQRVLNAAERWLPNVDAGHLAAVGDEELRLALRALRKAKEGK